MTQTFVRKLGPGIIRAAFVVLRSNAADLTLLLLLLLRADPVGADVLMLMPLLLMMIMSLLILLLPHLLPFAAAAKPDRSGGGGDRVLRAHSHVPREDTRGRASGEAGVRAAVTAGVACVEASAPRGETAGGGVATYTGIHADKLLYLSGNRRGAVPSSLSEEKGRGNPRVPSAQKHVNT